MHRSLGALGLLFALGLWSGCTSPEERFANHVARGERYSAENEPRKALLEYQSALKIRPDDAEINERVGDLLLEERAADDAAFFYREAHRLEPGRTSAVIKEARTLLFRDPRRAQQLLRQALEAAPDDADVHRALSELALIHRSVQPALEAATRAAELAPDDPASWMQLGKVHLARVRDAQLARRRPEDEAFEAAVAAFDRADQTAGGSVHARLEKARTLGVRRESREQSVQVYRDAMALALEQPDHLNRVVAAEATAQHARAVDDAELERFALRQLVSIAPARLDAWSRLSSLAPDVEAGDAIYAELLAKRPQDPLAHVSYANFLIRSRRSDDAIVHLEEALEDGVASPLMWEQLLRLRLGARLYADARATFVRMADAFPNDPITRRAEARLALLTGHTEQAAEILRALVLEDETVESQLLLARAEQRLGNLQRALAAVDRAIALEQGFSASSLELKARIHFEAGEWAPAVQALNEIVARGAELRERDRILRGTALYELGRAGLGRQALLRALEEPRPLPNASLEYLRREGERDPEGARAHLEKAFENHPTHVGVLEALSLWDAREGRLEQAIARLDGVIESRRVKPQVLLLRADLHARAGDFDAAEADALRAFEADPDSPEALDLLFGIYVAKGDTAEVTRSFREAEEAGVLHAGARLLLGRLALHEGDVATARRMFEKVLEEHPDMASAQSDLALLLAKQDEDLERALTLAKQAQQGLDRDPGVAYRLGYAYLRSGRHEAALVELRRARELADGAHRPRLVPPIYYHMGLALRALDRDQEAIEAFESALALDAAFPEADDARRQIEGLRAAAKAANAS